MHLLSDASLSLDAAWAGVLVAFLGLVLTVILAGFTAMTWFIKTAIKAAILDLKRELEEKIEGAVDDAAAARHNSDATLHNQVLWMDATHNNIDHSRIMRPENEDDGRV